MAAEKGIQSLVEQINDHKERCAVFDSRVFSSISAKDQKRLQEQFDLWWDSWIQPKLDAIHANVAKGEPIPQHMRRRNQG